MELRSQCLLKSVHACHDALRNHAFWSIQKYRINWSIRTIVPLCKRMLIVKAFVWFPICRCRKVWLGLIRRWANDILYIKLTAPLYRILTQQRINSNIKGWSRVGARTGTLKNPTKCLWRWEPDRRSYFFFSPPAHLCAVTYMNEISLWVTLNKQFNSTQHIDARTWKFSQN